VNRFLRAEVVEVRDAAHMVVGDCNNTFGTVIVNVLEHTPELTAGAE
jgi:hypothetical protein